MPLSNDLEKKVLLILIWSWIIGALAWLSKSLKNSGLEQSFPKILGGMIGSGIAAVSVSSLLIAMTDVKVETIIAVSGIVGWIGGNILYDIADIALDMLRKFVKDKGD